MTPKDFIINLINELVTIFPNIRVRYEDHQLSKTHFIEVVPNEVYHLNEEYKIWEEQVTFNFIENYPDHNLCFISDDAVVGIENIDYEAKGELYDSLYAINELCYQQVETINLNIGNLGQSISTIISIEPSVVSSRITGSFFNITNNYVNVNYGIASFMDAGRPSIEDVDDLIYPQAA